MSDTVENSSPSGQQQTDEECSREIESTWGFVLWSLENLGAVVTRDDRGRFCARLPEDYPDPFGAGDELEFSFGKDDLSVDGPFFCWWIRQLDARHRVFHAAPEDQPRSVHELSSLLFSAYQFPKGKIHLGGCTLEDQALLRFTYTSSEATVPATGELVHTFLTTEGQAVKPAWIRTLGLGRLTAYPQKPPAIGAAQAAKWQEMIGQQAEGQHGPVSNNQLLAITVVWCKYAEGTLVFSADDRAVEVPFSGLAQLFSSQTPPPVVCPVTGKSSHEVEVLDDGRITVPDAVGICEISGKRVLTVELTTCETTGKTALAEYFETCPVSARRVLRDEFQACAMCGQSVAKDILKQKNCSACNSLHPVRKDDPRIARVLGQYSKLDRWRGWRIGETASVYVLTATAVLRRLLLVLDQDTLEPRRIAFGSRLHRRWNVLPPAQWPEYLA